MSNLNSFLFCDNIRTLMLFMNSFLFYNSSVNDDDEDEREETKHDETQTGSMDSGLDSDSDMEATVDQSEEMDTESRSRVHSSGQSHKLLEENKLKNGQIDLELKQKNRDRSQEDGHSITAVFRESLSWYTSK